MIDHVHQCLIEAANFQWQAANAIETLKDPYGMGCIEMFAIPEAFKWLYRMRETIDRLERSL